ncbi:MAG: ABC transporter permease subunit [Gammaproteobacteria bacterium]|nr:ABC transporter permease subunit [Gammaproteobacteria bacterium]
MNDLNNDYDSVKDRVRALLDKQSDGGHHRFRRIKDSIAKHSIAFGGVSVIIAVVMIFFYLLYVVFPIFKSAEIAQLTQYDSKVEESVMWGMEEYGEIGYRVTKDGFMRYFNAETGDVIDYYQFALEENERVTSALYANKDDNLIAIGLDSGRVLLVKQTFSITYPDDQRKITPGISYPYGEESLDLGANSIKHVAAAKNDDTVSVVAADVNGELYFVRYELQESFLSEEISLEKVSEQVISNDTNIKYLLHDPTAHWVYTVSDKGELVSYYFEDGELSANERLALVDNKTEVTDVKFLLGGISLMVGDSKGVITQWFPVRDETNTYRLNKIRTFEFGESAIKTITPELRRKGFLVLNEDNELGIFFTTSHRTVLTESLSNLDSDSNIAINPRANRVLISGKGKAQLFELENEHPDVSWSALWGEVWYESYPEPDYTYQSSASNTDFEAKFSLVPLSFGTLKAAFYAMLFAMPLAICGAIFTAYFMAPQMRSAVKPAVEIMEALPTVILGFLAGLWLAPVMEENLPGIFMLLILMPLFIIAFGLAWHFMPTNITSKIPDGWQAALLIPVVIFIAWLCFTISYPVEKVLFDGDMRIWLGDMGITYDQRNAMVVGIAMGFAVIPTIFSIAEDAIFSVPKHLSNGSLALGASPWQTLVRVVLPTASPGIFSAVMIGLGRAVGETMIVLMATGNTPIMEANIFEGMRTLSANIAVEMPESEVGSTHYRVLFLAGFVLFVFTFLFNTLAENVRHRLRRKYGSL